MSAAHPVTSATGSEVKVRFCPSPTGTPHVGLIRTALFNWATARHSGGTFVFRIEDTDAARDSEQSYGQLIDALTWLGLDWDEGVDVGGPDGPYRQSQRGDVYRDVAERLVAAGHLYESYLTAEEIEARNRAEGRAVQQGYGNWERDLPEADRQRYREEGRRPALRLRVPDEDLSFDDLVRGPITFASGSFPDFVLVRPGGQPLYTFTNPVDDALMGITHVLRGEDLLPSTPRQIALYGALIDIGVAREVPRFGHLPLVLGDGTKKLSKRDPEANLFLHRERGFLPEGLLNYLALLGWSLAPDRDVFSREEMAAAFDVTAVNGNPAHFDLKKAEADQRRPHPPAGARGPRRADGPLPAGAGRAAAGADARAARPAGRADAARAGADAAAGAGAGPARLLLHHRGPPRRRRPGARRAPAQRRRGAGGG